MAQHTQAFLALARNVSLIEVHVIDNKKNQPDATSSLDYDSDKITLKARDKFFIMNSLKVNKDNVAKNYLTKILLQKCILERKKPKGYIIKN